MIICYAKGGGGAKLHEGGRSTWAQLKTCLKMSSSSTCNFSCMLPIHYFSAARIERRQ